MGDKYSTPDSTSDPDPNSPVQSKPPEEEPKSEATVSENLNEPGSNETSVPKAPAENDNKVTILFKNVGGAPVLKIKTFKVEASRNVSYIVEFIRKVTKLDAAQSIFIYINQSFAPSLDQTIKNLYDCYACDKKLVLHYAITPAWG